eukprot:SAG31_NODE_5536_length_2470_cov_2.418389_3_plen_52_part_00
MINNCLEINESAVAAIQVLVVNDFIDDANQLTGLPRATVFFYGCNRMVWSV